MLKVLYADTNEKNRENFENIMTKDTRFEIFQSNTGKNTIDTYYNINPDIFVLDSDFIDLNSFDLLRKLSISIDEKEKCNTILMTKKDYIDKITNFSKIYSILYKPFSLDILINLLSQMYEEKNVININMNDIYSYFSDFKMHLSISGCQYMKSAIEICLRHYPFYGSSLDDLLEKLADEYNKTPEQIRDGLKSALKPINISSQKYARQLYPEIFNDDYSLSPRKFIERSTIYFYNKQKNKK